ncbi:MAG: hypothetical protein H7Z73_01655 [Candidatus Saccharibacteria bacterium]|nr:hypothetical protein [Moraxellaceae bacterium]
MKAIQVIDGADNCLYELYSATDDEFTKLFPDETDIQFIEDVLGRLGEVESFKLLANLWSRPLDKKEVNGIYGTLFYEQYYKNVYFPTRKEAEITALFRLAQV